MATNTTRGSRVVTLPEVKAEMKRVLDDIQSGRFARDWVLENKAGLPSFKATRRRSAEHQIEQVGEKLRAMMPWIAANRLVDKTKIRGFGGLPEGALPPATEALSFQGYKGIWIERVLIFVF